MHAAQEELMRRRTTLAAALTVIGLLLTLTPPAGAACNPDAVQVGPTCIDKYEVSVWSIPDSSLRLLSMVKMGRATLANLTATAQHAIDVAAALNATMPR
jgi:hypothetical protein